MSNKKYKPPVSLFKCSDEDYKHYKEGIAAAIWSAKRVQKLFSKVKRKKKNG